MEPPSYDSLTWNAVKAKERLDVQFKDIQTHWMLRSIFELTRVDKKVPARVVELILRKLVLNNTPGARNEVPFGMVKAQVEARAQAMLNLKNITMLSAEKAGFKGSADALAIEAQAVRQFYEDDNEIVRDILDLLSSKPEAPVVRVVDESVERPGYASAPTLPDNQHDDRGFAVRLACEVGRTFTTMPSRNATEDMEDADDTEDTEDAQDAQDDAGHPCLLERTASHV